MTLPTNDLKLAVRGLFRNPLFSIVAILSLSLGIGANTAIFTLIDQILLRRLPVKNPDELVMRVIPDASTQLLALENGEVDFLWGVPGSQLGRLSSDPRFRTAQTAYHPGGSNCIMTVSFNLDRPVLQDVRVRRALAHATDRQPFVTQVLFGEGRVAAADVLVAGRCPLQ